MSDTSQEKIIGEIPVQTRLAFGSERLRLLVTVNRLLVVREGKRGAAGIAGATFLGRLSSAVEDIFKSSRESKSMKHLAERNPDSILRMNRENFAIPYHEIVSVTLTDYQFITEMIILTRMEKYKFTTSSKIAEVSILLRPGIGERLSIRA